MAAFSSHFSHSTFEAPFLFDLPTRSLCHEAQNESSQEFNLEFSYRRGGVSMAPAETCNSAGVFCRTLAMKAFLGTLLRSYHDYKAGEEAKPRGVVTDSMIAHCSGS